jgi:AcrR family transcriptional regulator
MKVRTEAKRDAIIEEARALFLEVGYERASMSELTRRLGGSKTTLYGYFASKQDIFMAVIEALSSEHLAGASAELETMQEVGVTTALQRYAEHLLTLMLSGDSLPLQRMILGESGVSSVGEIFVEHGPKVKLAEMAAALQAAMDRHELQPGPAEVLALQFFSLVRAEVDLRVYMREAPPLSPQQLKAMARRAVEMFMGGYRAVSTPEPAA